MCMPATAAASCNGSVVRRTPRLQQPRKRNITSCARSPANPGINPNACLPLSRLGISSRRERNPANPIRGCSSAEQRMSAGCKSAWEPGKNMDNVERDGSFSLRQDSASYGDLGLDSHACDEIRYMYDDRRLGSARAGRPGGWSLGIKNQSGVVPVRRTYQRYRPRQRKPVLESGRRSDGRHADFV